MCHANNELGKKITEGMELPNKEKIRAHREKETYKYFEVHSIKQVEMKKKFKNPVKRENFSKPNFFLQNSHRRDKH